jgi:hypothetical protein
MLTRLALASTALLGGFAAPAQFCEAIHRDHCSGPAESARAESRVLSGPGQPRLSPQVLTPVAFYQDPSSTAARPVPGYPPGARPRR